MVRVETKDEGEGTAQSEQILNRLSVFRHKQRVSHFILH